LLFSSYIFILLFLPGTLFAYYLLNHFRFTTAARVFLVAASLFFLSWSGMTSQSGITSHSILFGITTLSILLGSILVNYTIGRQMTSASARTNKNVSRGTLLLFGLAFNLGLLGYFKYMNFFIDSINMIKPESLIPLNIALPLGISFFTLQQIAFLIDAYEGLAEEHNLLDYTLFISFFPQLIAGPIIHHKEMMPQFQQPKHASLNRSNILPGLFIFSIGLFKKVVIADTFAVWANAGFDTGLALTFLEGWACSLSYTMQVYFDLSGYADMAVGLGLMFNIVIPINFNSPYKATSIIDFWRRWHITVTRCITTYIFTPLVRGATRPSFTRSIVAIFVAMCAVGFWHGAEWSFLLFGIVHGGALTINHIGRRLKIRMPHFVAWFLTFNFVNASFIIFRSTDLASGVNIFKSMVGLGGRVATEGTYIKLAFPLKYDVWIHELLIGVQGEWRTILFIIMSMVACIFLKNSNEMQKNFTPTLPKMIQLVTTLIVAVLAVNEGTSFLYFQF
jgi:alginate O-acetyltransferase complex protein AlgI